MTRMIVIMMVAAWTMDCGGCGEATASSPCHCELPAVEWQPITVHDGWLAQDGLACWRNPWGIVHLRGALRADSDAGWLDQPFILPEDCRPGAETYLPIRIVGSMRHGVRTIVMNPSGVVSGVFDVGGLMFLDSITFDSSER